VTGTGGPGGSIPWVNAVFEQPWWLDAVAPGAWHAVEIRAGDQLVARQPYVLRRRRGVSAIVQPPLTQVLGPWLAPMAGKYARRLETEKKLLGQLIEGLPPTDHFHMNFSTTLTNGLPFHWAGFQSSVRYTYRIDDLSDLGRIRDEFQEHVRRGIKKAESAVEVVHDFPVEELIALDVRTYARQGSRPAVSADLIRRLEAACAAQNARRILGAVDAEGRTHAALMVVWDERTLYALINARDPEFQTFGSNTLLYWEAIKLAAEVSQAFDFEGSMIEPVEHFFRGFGGRQTPYLSMTRSDLKARSLLAARSARQAVGRWSAARARRDPSSTRDE